MGKVRQNKRGRHGVQRTYDLLVTTILLIMFW